VFHYHFLLSDPYPMASLTHVCVHPYTVLSFPDLAASTLSEKCEKRNTRAVCASRFALRMR